MNALLHFVKTERICIPSDYDPNSFLFDFKAKHGNDFACFNPHIADLKFKSIPIDFRPGAELRSFIFRLDRDASFESVAKTIRSSSLMFPGVRGLAYIWAHNRSLIPEDRWTAALDIEDALWRDPDGDLRFPSIRPYANGTWGFDLEFASEPLYEQGYVLCFSR